MASCRCQPDLGGKDKPNPQTTPPDSTPPDSGVNTTGCPIVEVEPNNSVAEGTDLPPERLACGVIGEPGDIDFYVSEVTEEGWISISSAALAIASNANIQMVVTPPAGTAAVRADDEGTVDASLRFPGSPGTWEIQLSEQNFNGGEDYFYELVVSSAKAPLEWSFAEVEPNDELITAVPVVHGDAVFGDMGQNLDGDWYRIDVPPGKHELEVEVVAFAEGSAGDFVLYLSDSAENLLPLGCNPATTCANRGNPIDPALHDPILSWTSDGNEQLFVKISEENFQWGRPSWYVITFSLVAS